MIHKTDECKKEKDKIHMWKCIRCQKENQDTEENCTGCGHGRTMDYISHRTLAKISRSLSENWKRTNREEFRQKRNKPVEQRVENQKKENRKEAEKFVQEKLADLTNSVKDIEKKISDGQNEINTLNWTVQERNEVIEKNEKIEQVRDNAEMIVMILNSIGGILCYLWSLYRTIFEVVPGEVSDKISGVSEWAIKPSDIPRVDIPRLDISGLGLEEPARLTVAECIKQDFKGFATGVISEAIVCAIMIYLATRVLIIIESLIVKGAIRLILGKLVKGETLKKLTEERDNARQLRDAKTNEITVVQAQLNSLKQQIQRIEKDREFLNNKLDKLSPQEMEKEFARLV
jgi:peptidoglycan hydrolase CwlO-like protein